MQVSRTIALVLLSLQLMAAADVLDDPGKPWVVTGRVETESGEPIAGAEIRAATGLGTLLGGGSTTSKADGTFELRFGAGIHFKDQEGVQAATISARKDGWFETNLYRQGDLIAAFKLPKGEIGWGNKTTNDLFLPGQPRKLKFIMSPAARISGILVDAAGAPVKNKRVGLTGDELPPSSSVFAEVKTTDQGEFEFKNVPTTFKVKLYAESKANWREWPNFAIRFSEAREFKVRLTQKGETLELSSEPKVEVLERNTRLFR